MNNNRGSSRRRGRGSNRQQGGQQLNRIDSRARGNAPQLLEKYKKLAHDSHLNGDRVQEEYYLQFADHYFRVIADQKQRQEEARQRRDERSSESSEGERGASETRDDQRSGSNAPRGDQESSRRETARSDGQDQAGEQSAEASETDASQENIYEPVDNPFTRDARGSRSAKPRKPRRNSRKADDEDTATEKEAAELDGNAEAPVGLDPSALPPAISGDRQGADGDSEEKAEAKPRRRTTRRSKPPADDTGESLQAVN